MEILYFKDYPEKCSINWDNFDDLSMDTIFFELKFIKKVKNLCDLAKWVYVLSNNELTIINKSLVMEKGFEKYIPKIYFKSYGTIYCYEFHHGCSVKRKSIENEESIKIV